MSDETFEEFKKEIDLKKLKENKKDIINIKFIKILNVY